MPNTVKCPFYLFEKGSRIKCENESRRFNCNKDKLNYQKKNCCTNWQNCENAKFLLNYYKVKEK